MRVALVLLPFVLVLTEPAHGWGQRGHLVINRLAVQSLPDDGPVFLKAHEEWIAQRAVVPDSWRAPSEPFVKIIEDPNHHWYKESFSFLKVIPRSRYEFVLALHDEFLRTKGAAAPGGLPNIFAGTLPYEAVEIYERMKAGMRTYRSQKSAGQDTRLTELDLAFEMGWLGHYIGDGAQPLHTSVNSDIWKLPNPKGYTTDQGIHGRFETAYVDMLGVTVDDVRSRVGKPQVIPDPFDAVLAHLDRSASHMEQIYQLDLQGAFKDTSNADARNLVLTQLAAGAQMLRDLTYTAWVESVKPALPRAGPADPINPANPRYNPATGSAPAAR